MGAKKSQRNAALAVFGIIAAGYLVNFVIFKLPPDSQLTAGGLLLVASGAGLIYFLGAPETLSCDRALNACRLVSPRFLLTPKSVVTLPLDRLRGVGVQETYVSSHDGPGHTGYEVRLEIGDGRAHVFSTYDNRQSADVIVRRVRSFLKDDGRPSLTLRRFPRALIAVGVASIILGALLVVCGAAGWSSAPRA